MTTTKIDLLDRSHRDEIRNAMKRISVLMPLVDKAERCGSQCQEFRVVLTDLYQKMGTILNEFFPDASQPPLQ